MQSQGLSAGSSSASSGMAGQVDAAGEKPALGCPPLAPTGAAEKVNLEPARPGFKLQSGQVSTGKCLHCPGL